MNSTGVDEYEYDDDYDDYDEGYKHGYEDGSKDKKKERRKDRQKDEKRASRPLVGRLLGSWTLWWLPIYRLPPRGTPVHSPFQPVVVDLIPLFPPFLKSRASFYALS